MTPNGPSTDVPPVIDGDVPSRIGSVPYLNAVPLTCGLQPVPRLVPPSRLATMLRSGELDAALVSITEVLFHDAYEVLDDIAIASNGPVRSVFLAHRAPLTDVDVVACDTASLTSVNLLRVLLAERGIHPRFEPLTDYAAAAAAPAVLLIGDAAIEFHRQHRADAGWQFWDLGSAWRELTGRPFVYAVWALRRGIDTTALRRELKTAKWLGLDAIEQFVRILPPAEREFRREYLGTCIRYHLGPDEKAGIQRFCELLRKHLPGQPVFSPHYVV